MTGDRILLVEDDESIGASVETSLTRAGYGVTRTVSGEDAFFLATTRAFDLILLDLGLPGRDGLEVLSALRQRERSLPVLILSARGEVPDRVAGLQRGADDYLPKPFSMVELEARVQVLLRRGRQSVQTKLEVHDLQLDVTTRKVTRSDATVELTALEFDLLHLLIRHAHAVVSRETIVREIWREVARATPLDNVIDVHIGRVRRKVDKPPRQPLIHTIRGLGFMLSDRNEP